jgi:ribonuclease HI
VKVNCDASLDKTQCRVGLRIIIRDHGGNVLLARSFTKVGTVEPSAAEAMALFQGVIQCQSLGLQKLILEGEAKVVLDALGKKIINRSRYGHLVEDIRVILNSFPHWRCKYVSSREANNAAHKLAKAATTIWSMETPVSIRDIVALEQFALS